MKLTRLFVGSSWLLHNTSITLSRISPASPEKTEYKRNRTNKGKAAGLLDVILELRSSKLTSFEPK